MTEQKRSARDDGRTLRKIRKAMGLSLRQMAVCVGVSHATLDRFERGIYPVTDGTMARARTAAVRMATAITTAATTANALPATYDYRTEWERAGRDFA